MPRSIVSEPRPALIAAALERALFDEQERARVLGASNAVLARYSWADTASRLLDVLEEVGEHTNDAPAGLSECRGYRSSSRPTTRLGILSGVFGRSARPSLVADYDVTLVDNASGDETRSIVRDRFPHVRLVAASQNLGFAAANNLGIRETDSDLILLLNPDTVVGARGDRHADCRPRHPARRGRVRSPAGRRQRPSRTVVWKDDRRPSTKVRQKLLVRGHANRWPGVSPLVEWLTRRPSEPDWVSGACLCVRRADAEAVGLLDERYFLYAEDVDFCAALRAQGRRVLFVPEADVVHLRGQSRRSAASASERAYRRSQLAFYRKHHPGWAPWLALYLWMRGKT